MRVPQQSTSVARYNNLKATLEKAASKPSNEALFKKEGDRFELTQSVRFSLDGQDVVVKKGSAFDNDIKTLDKISTEVKNGETVEIDSFEHFSEKRGLIFKRDVEMMKVSYADQQGMNFSNSSSTFEI